MYLIEKKIRKLLFVSFIFTIFLLKSCLSLAYGQDVINVKAFGAKGDGKSDDISAFELAIKNLKEWETFYIPNGVYRISQPLLILNKHRIKIRSDGVIKPHTKFEGDYLVKFINNQSDNIIPSMGMNIIIDNLTLDCEWKTRGVFFDGIYDFSIKDLHIWRPSGHAIKIKRAQEGSFWKPVIFAGKAKTYPNSESIQNWDPQKKYHPGELVRINYPPYDSKKTYKKGDLVNFENLLYRSLSDFNQGKSPTDYPEYWEWLPFEYFVATNLPNNTNKNPLSGFTTRNSDETKRYWQPIHLNESALEIVSEKEGDTIDNIKFFNLTIRSSINNPLIRIDNIKNPLKPLKIEFYASQIHIITEPYINAFNRNLEYVKLYGGSITIPNHFILIHVHNSYGLKFIGGNFQLGKIVKAKAFHFGTLGKKNDSGSGNTALTFLNSFSIEGSGMGQVGISILPSVETFSKWFQDGVFITLNGNQSIKIIDLYEETSKSVSESCGKLYRP